MAKAKNNVLGAWAFLIGVIIAILAGFVPTINLESGLWAGIFVALGIVIGLLNITAKEIKDFLLAGTVLVIVSVLGANTFLVLPYVGEIIRGLVLLFTPATIIAALKVVFAVANR